MHLQLLVERDQNECIVKLAGTAYKFKRNEHGHLVSEITDQEHIKWVSDPTHNTSFKMYSAPEKKIIDEVVDEAVSYIDQKQTDDVSVSDDSDVPDRPPYPQKGSKRPPKRSEG